MSWVHRWNKPEPTTVASYLYYHTFFTCEPEDTLLSKLLFSSTESQQAMNQVTNTDLYVERTIEQNSRVIK